MIQQDLPGCKCDACVRHVCVCGYRAIDCDDLESHILLASRLNDNSTHAEG